MAHAVTRCLAPRPQAAPPRHDWPECTVAASDRGSAECFERSDAPDAFELFSLFILILLGSFAWKYFRSGSLVGAMVGGRVRETLGEIPLQKSPGGFVATVLRVHVVEPRSRSEPLVGLAVTSKSPLGASMVPFWLTREQAREVGDLLRRAAAS